jgi:hydrogenase maturation protease
VSPRALVIGIGNTLRGDDAVGLAVARGLAAAPPRGVRVLAYEGAPIDLL